MYAYRIGVSVALSSALVVHHRNVAYDELPKFVACPLNHQRITEAFYATQNLLTELKL